MNTRKIIITATLSILAITAMAQQDVQFTHYMYNTLAVNPAYAGSRKVMNISALHRQQWLGIEGAPMTQTFAINTPFIRKNVGVGLSLVNDKTGPIHQSTFYTDYSFSIKMSEKAKLALGLKAGFNLIQANISKLRTTELGDPSFASNPENKLAPNFGFGVFYHSDLWYLGVSTPKLLETKIENASTDKITRMIRHYYILGGVVATASPDVKIKPAFQTKLTKNAPVSFDLSCEAYYKERVSVGIMNRMGDSFGLLVGYQFTPQLKTGVSYDYTISPLTNYNSGTVEIFVSFDFIFKKEKTITPRYF